jgi:hypothetical protein
LFKAIGAIMSFRITATGKWQPSGIVFDPSLKVAVRYKSGVWTQNPDTGMHDANGDAANTAKDGYALAGVNEAALIGKIGISGTPFLVGMYRELGPNLSDQLFLTINDDLDNRYGLGYQDNSGEIEVEFDLLD